MAGRAPLRAAPGRAATRPSQYRGRDWKAIMGRVFLAISEDHLTLVAAGVAFYAMLALFPAIAAFIGFYGLVAEPSEIEALLAALKPLMPPDAFGIVRTQVDELLAASTGTLGLASVASSLLALWSAKAGVSGMIVGLNIVYDEVDRRSIVRGYALALALTALLLVVGIAALGSVVVLPAVLGLLPLGPLGEWIARLAPWPVLTAAIIVSIGALYRYAPHRHNAQVRWVTWGAVAATMAWLVASVLFSVYVARFAGLNETYGSLGAIVCLLLWFYVSAFVVLLGAELNAEMEHHTAQDTTTGPPKPMGERGAYVADHVA